MQTLESLIKKKISSRIILCIIITTAQSTWLSISNFNHKLKVLTNRIETSCKSLEDFVISQVLVPNDAAIEYKIQEFNKLSTYKIQWIQANTTPELKFKINWNTTWDYYYPLRSIDNNKFGYFAVHGTVFREKELYNDIKPYLITIVLSSALMLILLLPLAKSIPKSLFIEPINNLLFMLKNSNLNRNCNITTNSYELYEIQYKIQELLDYINIRSKNEAIGKLAEHVAHDIRSPLLTLNSILSKNSIKITSNDIIILRNITQRINEITNELLFEHSTNSDNHYDKVVSQSKHLTKAQQYILLKSALNELIVQKNIEWANSQCNIQFNTTISVDSWVYVNYSDFHRSISNLLNNAYESLYNDNRNINISLSDNNDFYTLNICDTGCGIPSEEITNVLRGKSFKRDGHGLGLSSAYSYFTSINCTFNISSIVNEGTNITISFPKLTIPTWYTRVINYNAKSEFIILDDSPSILIEWEQKLLKKTQKVKFFCSPTDIFEWFSKYTPHNNNVILISDYNLNDDHFNGVDIIKKLNFSNSFLITNHAETASIQEQASELKFYLIPKHLIDYIQLNYYDVESPLN
jgi:signal transduction histidine kinase